MAVEQQTPQRGTAGAFHEYITVGPPFRLNTDSSPANLQPGEVPWLDNFFERSGKLWPWFKTTVDLIPGADHDAICNSFALTFPASLVANIEVTMVFTINNLYYNISGTGLVAGGLTLAAPGGGSTAISADGGGVGDKFSISVVNNIVYFSHNGKGPLRKWDPTAPANYNDVAAPGSGWHVGVKLKPIYLTAITNQLICVGDTSAPGSPYDVAWSNPGLPEDFTPFGGGHILLADTPDPITACSTIFGKLIIYKTDCIIIGVVQQDAISPFFFERYQQGAQASEGCVAPYTLAGNGFTDYFLSRTGVKSFDGSTLQPIGQGIDHGLFSQVSSHSFPPAMCGALGALHLTSLDTSGTLAYAIGFYSASGSNQAYIYNTKSGTWSRGLNLSGSASNRTGGTIASIGSAWYYYNRLLAFGGQGLGLTENVLNLPTIDDTNANIFPANLSEGESPVIQLPPSIYGQPQNQKTIYRLGVAFDCPQVGSQIGVGGTQPFNGKVFVNTSYDSGNGQNTSQLYRFPAGSATTNPSNSQFAWMDTQVTDRMPSIVLKFRPQAATATSFAAIDSLTVEFSRGADQ